MRAVISGSSSGLGLAIARHFARNGIDVAVTARKAERLNEITQEIKSENPDVEVLGELIDFSKGERVAAYCDSIGKKWAGIDILINNVGLYSEDRATDDIETSLKGFMEINLYSAVRMIKGLLPCMAKSRNSFIFNVISISALSLRSEAASYSISKLAMKGYTDLLREELRAVGTKVIGIYPGPMNTSSWDGEDDVDRSSFIQPEDVVNSILSILDLSVNTTVENLVINPVRQP